MLASPVWGDAEAPVYAEHGQDVTEWNPSCDWYSYGIAYGFNGCQHPGLDIGIPIGTPLYALIGGVVDHAGHSGYYLPLHVNIRTNAGEIHIYGHMSEVDPALYPGANVEAGQLLGKSGTQNGPHLHWERRAPNDACSSGYCFADPEDLNGPENQFSVGDRIQVQADELNLREQPSLSASILSTLGMSTQLCVTGESQQADGYRWSPVSTDDGGSGWVAVRYCALVSAGGCR